MMIQRRFLRMPLLLLLLALLASTCHAKDDATPVEEPSSTHAPDTTSSQSCSSEGVCFADEVSLHQHYVTEGSNVEIDFGMPQKVQGAEWRDTLERLELAREYIEKVKVNETMASVQAECQCRHELCSFWAAIGECENNPPYMLIHCAPRYGGL